MGSTEGAEDNDDDKKLELVRETYREVLDATKHQDDKIGRLLTGLAFLTAASLALAGLSGAEFLRRDFEITPFTLPLGLIALAAFLVGVVLAVLLLVASFGTPLRLPGQRPTRAPEAKDDVAWASGVRGSAVYFFEIANLSLGEWKIKWLASSEDLERERRQSLVHETHNLAARTAFKYERVAEATSIVSLALLSFVLAGLFVLFAADASTVDAEPLALSQRWVLGAVVAAASLLQVQARLRYRRQSVDEAPPLRDWRGPGLVAWASRVFAVVVSAALLLLIVPGGRWHGGAALAVLLGLLGVASLWLMVLGEDRSKVWKARTDQGRGAQRWRRRRRVLIIVTVVGVSLTIVTALLFWSDLYGWRLAAAVVVEVMLTLPSFASPSLEASRRRQEFDDRERKRRDDRAPERVPSAVTGQDTGQG